MMEIFKIIAGAILAGGLVFFTWALVRAAGWADRHRPQLPEETDVIAEMANAGVSYEEAAEAVELLRKMACGGFELGDDK